MKDLAQAFGVITALMFLMSSITGHLVMKYTLGLDYFAVASTSDVIMLGVKSFGLAVLVVVVSLVLSQAFSWFRRRRRLVEIRKYRNLKGSPARWHLMMLKRDRDQATRDIGRSIIVSMPMVVIMAALLNAEPQRVVYVSGLNLPSACDYSPTLWMGSQSSVIKCSDGVRLIRDGENVVYFRPERRCNIIRHQCDFVGLDALREHHRSSDGS